MKMSVQELMHAIEALPDEDYDRLRQWISEHDWEKWDQQIEKDSRSGRLDFLKEEARTSRKFELPGNS